MNFVPFYFVAILAGAVLPIQALINARLGMALGGPLWAAAVSFAIGSAALVASQLVLRASIPTAAQIANTPPWIWIGGFLGAIYLGSAIASVSRIGAGAMTALIIVAQISSSLAIDHFGILVAHGHPLNPIRALGAFLLVSGVVLIVKF
jgi:bacterial/archaeal transporter family-2 protein